MYVKVVNYINAATRLEDLYRIKLNALLFEISKHYE